MFAGMEIERPYPATGLTTERWKEVPCFKIPIKDLWATQNAIYLDMIRHITKDYVSHCGDTIPHVVCWQGRFYLEDGHHRVVARLMRGKKDVLARVYTVISLP